MQSKYGFRILLIAGLIATTCFSGVSKAQQTVPTPASSVGGSGNAEVAFVIPSMPTNVCTSSNSNCYNANSPPPTTTAPGTLTFRHITQGGPPPGGWGNLWSHDELLQDGVVVSSWNYVCENCSGGNN